MDKGLKYSNWVQPPKLGILKNYAIRPSPHQLIFLLTFAEYTYQKMHISPFKALYPDAPRLHQEPTLFDTTKERYPDFLRAGLFQETPQMAIYLYEIQAVTRSYYGILTCTDVEDYLNGNIKKHENTLLAEEQKQMKLTLERQAAVKPVLLAYPNAPAIDNWVAEFMANHAPFFENYFENDQQTHRLWAVKNLSDIRALQILFADQVHQAYIADGHHRMCAMALIAQFNESESVKQSYRQVYCAFFPAKELEILAFNRWVQIPENFNITNLEALFEIKSLAEPALPQQPHELTLCTAQGWFQLHWKKRALQSFENEPVALDALLLNKNVLSDLLGIEDVRHDQRVAYVEAARSIPIFKEKITNNHWGFCLYPISFEDLQQVVEAGNTLPPKSTWFEPRMKNGLLVKTYG